MEDRERARLVGLTVAAMMLAVGWDLVGKVWPTSSAPPPPVRTDSSVSAPPPTPTRSEVGTAAPHVDSAALGALDVVARADIRRRIRESFPLTYLRDIVAESGDSMLHRWDDRVRHPVRVHLGSDTIANFRPAFLDAIRAAFARWGETGVPVRFDLSADSSGADVRF